MGREWESDYIDLRTRFLNDEEYDYLLRKYPESNLTKCPTCDDDGKYVYDDEVRLCDCEEQRALLKHYLLANIGPLYQRLSWDDYVLNRAVLAGVYGYLNHHRDMVRNGFGLTLFGPYGTGKTMLASLTAKAMVRLGYSVFFTTFPAVIEMFTSGWRDEDERRLFERRVVASDVLVLDDIGKEFKTKTNLSESTLDYILRQRVISLRPTIITTNLVVDELEEGYGRGVFSLLVERSAIQEVTGSDWRQNAQRRSFDEAMKGWRRPIS